MRRYGYPQSFATGVIAAGGTLGIMIPPSTVFAVYGLITSRTSASCSSPASCPAFSPSRCTCHDHDHRLCAAGLPARRAEVAVGEKLGALRDIWATLLLFVFVIGGIYGGLFTATEAAGMGAGGAFLIGVVRGAVRARS